MIYDWNIWVWMFIFFDLISYFDVLISILDAHADEMKRTKVNESKQVHQLKKTYIKLPDQSSSYSTFLQ